MKVIRSYNDYYDGVLANFAQEQIPFYLRKKIEVDKTEYSDLKAKLPRLQSVYAIPHKEDRDKYVADSRRNVELETAVIGFCGNLYVVFYEWFRHEDIPRHSFPSIDNLTESFEAVTRTWWYDFEYKQTASESNIQIIVDKWIDQKPLLDLFVKYAVPSFIYTSENLILNPCLKDFNMQKVLHPYTVVQELEMFLNNTLCDTNTPPMPVGDDVTIAKSKGYDEWSFRQKPGLKKRKNKKGAK